MTIDEFLEATGWTEAQLAAALPTDPPTAQSTISRLRRRERKASLVLCLALESATNGAIRGEDLPINPKTRRALASLRIRGAAPAQRRARKPADPAQEGPSDPEADPDGKGGEPEGAAPSEEGTARC